MENKVLEIVKHEVEVRKSWHSLSRLLYPHPSRDAPLYSRGGSTINFEADETPGAVGLLPMDSPHAIAKLGLCTLFSRRQTPRSRE